MKKLRSLFWSGLVALVVLLPWGCVAQKKAEPYIPHPNTPNYFVAFLDTGDTLDEDAYIKAQILIDGKDAGTFECPCENNGEITGPKCYVAVPSPYKTYDLKLRISLPKKDKSFSFQLNSGKKIVDTMSLKYQRSGGSVGNVYPEFVRTRGKVARSLAQDIKQGKDLRSPVGFSLFEGKTKGKDGYYDEFMKDIEENRDYEPAPRVAE